MMIISVSDAPWRPRLDGRHGWSLIGHEGDVCARGMSSSDALAVSQLVNAAFDRKAVGSSDPVVAIIRQSARRMLAGQTTPDRLDGAEVLGAVIALEDMVREAFRHGFSAGRRKGENDANLTTIKCEPGESECWSQYAALVGLEA